jgi:membrane-bound ClpP family serine protease
VLAFAIIGIIGLAILTISLIVGELFDAFDVADLGLSSIALGITLAGIGSIGVLSCSAGLNIWWATLIAIAVGAVVGGCTQLVINRAVAGDDGHAVFDVLNVQGHLTSACGPDSGEVRLDHPREVEPRLAWSDKRLASGTRVRVIAQVGSRVKVEKV